VPKKIPPSSSSDEDSDESPRSSVRSPCSCSSSAIDDEEDEREEDEEQEKEEEEEDAVGWSRCMSVAGDLTASIVPTWWLRGADRALIKGETVLMDRLLRVSEKSDCK